MQVDPARVLFTYWGRRGALSQFSLELAKAALAKADVQPTFSISRQNESFSAYRDLENSLLPVDTFATNKGAILNAWRIPLIQRKLSQHIEQHRIGTVVELMPHVWSPLVMPGVRSKGTRYITIVHDADPHPGDHTAWVKRFYDRTLFSANKVITLSQSVSARLIASGRVDQSNVATLFHPDLSYAKPRIPSTPVVGRPIRLLFIGRILSYKALPLFLDAIDILIKDGIPVEVGVFGEGELGANASRLANLKAEVVNRWLTQSEFGDALSRYQAVVLSHAEASQSGVAAAALGAGVPVVTTPVGGLLEQISDGVTGMVARSVDAPSLADAIKRLMLDPLVYLWTCERIISTRADRSMARFVDECVALTRQTD